VRLLIVDYFFIESDPFMLFDGLNHCLDHCFFWSFEELKRNWNDVLFHLTVSINYFKEFINIPHKKLHILWSFVVHSAYLIWQNIDGSKEEPRLEESSNFYIVKCKTCFDFSFLDKINFRELITLLADRLPMGVFHWSQGKRCVNVESVVTAFCSTSKKK